MTDTSPLPTPMSASHVVGEGYSFESIRAQLGGEAVPPHFVIHRARKILGLCLGLTWNPRAESTPGEVWVGRKGDLPKWGTTLAETPGPLPVYVRREEGGRWFLLGDFLVTGSTTEPEELKQRLKPPLIKAISRVVYLERAAVASVPPAGT